VDGGETQGLLRLDRHRPEDLQVRRALDGVIQQCRLPDSRLTPEDQRAGQPGTHAVEQRVQRLLFGPAVDEPHALTVAPITAPVRGRRTWSPAPVGTSERGRRPVREWRVHAPNAGTVCRHRAPAARCSRTGSFRDSRVAGRS
jgi:hypothetical protein